MCCEEADSNRLYHASSFLSHFMFIMSACSCCATTNSVLPQAHEERRHHNVVVPKRRWSTFGHSVWVEQKSGAGHSFRRVGVVSHERLGDEHVPAAFFIVLSARPFVQTRRRSPRTTAADDTVRSHSYEPSGKRTAVVASGFFYYRTATATATCLD